MKKTKKQKQKEKKIHITLLLAFIVGCSVIGAYGKLAERDTAYTTARIMLPARPIYRVETYDIASQTIREVTAYNVGVPNQTDMSPCIGASGENLCSLLAQREKICAANFVPLGTKLYIQNYGICRVADRMNSRYHNRVDIALEADEVERAVKFGRQKLLVYILK